MSSASFQPCAYKELLNMNLNSFLFLINFVSFSASFECGKVQIGTANIAGGEESKKGQWPWLAPIFFRVNHKFLCGSSIISKRHLLRGQWNGYFCILANFFLFYFYFPTTKILKSRALLSWKIQLTEKSFKFLLSARSLWSEEWPWTWFNQSWLK